MNDTKQPSGCTSPEPIPTPEGAVLTTVGRARAAGEEVQTVEGGNWYPATERSNRVDSVFCFARPVKVPVATGQWRLGALVRWCIGAFDGSDQVLLWRVSDLAPRSIVSLRAHLLTVESWPPCDPPEGLA